MGNTQELVSPCAAYAEMIQHLRFCSISCQAPLPLLYLNNGPIPGAVGDCSFVGKDGHLRKRVELSLNKFTISLKQGNSEPCDISSSPYSMDNLILAQGLNARFGGADHQKRNRSTNGDPLARKRQQFKLGL